eukprot:TRINITY_DN856_c0_g1_i1.p1 TRINITY_DN856_c0_g1~~TRINITY_DN856_c0_g1_i1.p1  ORF type:complete len:940 (-),score=77.57 TRINITY_DN856_c0_g1_i1:86-2521(-)
MAITSAVYYFGRHGKLQDAPERTKLHPLRLFVCELLVLLCCLPLLTWLWNTLPDLRANIALLPFLLFACYVRRWGFVFSRRSIIGFACGFTLYRWCDAIVMLVYLSWSPSRLLVSIHCWLAVVPVDMRQKGVPLYCLVLSLALILAIVFPITSLFFVLYGLSGIGVFIMDIFKPPPFGRWQNPEFHRMHTDGVDRPNVVDWYSARILASIRHMMQAARNFGNQIDTRAFIRAGKNDDELVHRYPDCSRLKFSADTGEEYWATTWLFSSLLRPQSGNNEQEIILLGGDLCYPYSDPSKFASRFIEPLCHAGSYAASRPLDMFAIPGNHDWFDSLRTFREFFCVRRQQQLQRHGSGRQNSVRFPQKASYFVLDLPQRWKLLGVDTGEDLSINDIDEEQAAFFATQLQNHNGGIILVTHCPYWILPPSGGLRFQMLLNDIRRVSPTFVWLAGDIHNYSRYRESETGSQFFVVGGGGAFLHPNPRQWAQTTMPKEFPSIATEIVNRELLTQNREAARPSTAESASLASLWRCVFMVDINAMGFLIGALLFCFASIPHPFVSLFSSLILFVSLFQFCAAEAGGVVHKLFFTVLHWSLHMATSFGIRFFDTGNMPTLISPLADPLCMPATNSLVLWLFDGTPSSTLLGAVTAIDMLLDSALPCWLLASGNYIGDAAKDLLHFWKVGIDLEWVPGVEYLSVPGVNYLLIQLIILATLISSARIVVALYFYASYNLSGWHWNEAFSAMGIVPKVSWIEIKFQNDGSLEISPMAYSSLFDTELIEAPIVVASQIRKFTASHSQGAAATKPASKTRGSVSS